MHFHAERKVQEQRSFMTLVGMHLEAKREAQEQQVRGLGQPCQAQVFGVPVLCICLG